MDTVILSSLLNGALLLVCLGLLLSFCVSCGQSRRQSPIHQQGGFTVIRGKAPYRIVDTNTCDHVPRPGLSNPAISATPTPATPRSLRQEPERRPSYTPTEDDDDYVNQGSNGYIYVIPEDTPSTAKNESQPNQASGNDDYVNVEQESESGNVQAWNQARLEAALKMEPVPHDDSLIHQKPPEDHTLDAPNEKTELQETGIGDDLCSSDSENYINMPEPEKGGLTPGQSQESMESDGNGSTEYVNTSPK